MSYYFTATRLRTTSLKTTQKNDFRCQAPGFHLLTANRRKANQNNFVIHSFYFARRVIPKGFLEETPPRQISTTCSRNRVASRYGTILFFFRFPFSFFTLRQMGQHLLAQVSSHHFHTFSCLCHCPLFRLSVCVFYSASLLFYRPVLYPLGNAAHAIHQT